MHVLVQDAVTGGHSLWFGLETCGRVGQTSWGGGSKPATELNEDRVPPAYDDQPHRFKPCCYFNTAFVRSLQRQFACIG